MVEEYQSKYGHLPYRKGVGLMILNKDKKVFVGRRIDTKTDAWQMPQGGIDNNESPADAAMREMDEEIGTSNGVIIAESSNWFNYDLPESQVPKIWDGKFRGQEQKWFLVKFTGTDQEINLAKNDHPEFLEWKWIDIEELPFIVIPFKKRLYISIIEEFTDTIRKFHEFVE